MIYAWDIYQIPNKRGVYTEKKENQSLTSEKPEYTISIFIGSPGCWALRNLVTDTLLLCLMDTIVVAEEEEEVEEEEVVVISTGTNSILSVSTICVVSRRK